MFYSDHIHNEFSPAESTHYSPQMAVVIHDNGQSAIVSRHIVEPDGSIGSGCLISPADLKDIAEDAIERDSGSCTVQRSLFSERILFSDHKCLVWYAPSQLRFILINVHGRNECLKVRWPSLIFKAQRESKSLQVAAVKFKRRPKVNDLVYRAPLWNIYDKGFMCHGTARIECEIKPENIEELENLLFDSVFTHTNCSNKELTGKQDWIKFWRDNSSKRPARFPTKMLNKFTHPEAPVTVADFIASVDA